MFRFFKFGRATDLTTGEISSTMMQVIEIIQVAKGAQESASAASQLAKLGDEQQKLVIAFILGKKAIESGIGCLPVQHGLQFIRKKAIAAPEIWVIL